MKESKAMMRKEVGFMKKAGAPKSMIKHEEREMRAAKPKKMMGGGIATNTKAPPAPNTPGSPSAFAKLSSAQKQPIQARGPASVLQQAATRNQDAAKKFQVLQEMAKKQARGPASVLQQAATRNQDAAKKFQVLQEMAKKQAYAAGGRIASKGEHAVQRRAKRGAKMVKMARGGRYC